MPPDGRSTMRNPGPAGRPDLGIARRPALVIGCGALAEELVDLTRRAGLPSMDLACLPASLHNRPEQIPARVAARIRRARRDGYDRIFLAYADCGTGGLLDRMLETEPAAAGVARLEGAHCYEVYAGRTAFAALHEQEPGTFYLTDYLARNFDRLVMRGLGLDRHPELLPLYFGNYHRLVFLAQTDDADLASRAATAAAQLGLAFERRLVGLGELATSIAMFAAPRPLALHGTARHIRRDGGLRDGGLRAIRPSAMRHAHESRRIRSNSGPAMTEAHQKGPKMRAAHQDYTTATPERRVHEHRSSRSKDGPALPAIGSAA